MSEVDSRVHKAGECYALRVIARHIGCYMPTYQAVQKHYDRLTAELATKDKQIESLTDRVSKDAMELTATREENERLRELRSVLDIHLGDTDPAGHPDEWKDSAPVAWVCYQISLIINAREASDE